MKKNQSKRLTEQHKESHGVIGIFGEGLADVANAGEEDKTHTPNIVNITNFFIDFFI